MRTWHDFHIIGYAVDSKREELTFELEWPYESATDVRQGELRFAGVESYYLEHDLGSNIIYSFTEVPLRKFLEEWAERFDIECKWGWPKFWRPKPYPPRPLALELEESLNSLMQKQLQCIQLTSSFLISDEPQQAHVVSYRGMKMGSQPQEVNHEDEPSSVSTGTFDGRVHGPLRQR